MESNYPDWCREDDERRRIQKRPDKVQQRILREDIEWEIEVLEKKLTELYDMLAVIDED